MEGKTIRVYRADLDVIKGIAILAVILFHLGLVKSGYLGVDAFLVINGFLIIPNILKKVETGNFSLWLFLKKRIARLWPMVILATFVCMIIGYWGMLPDDYENLGENVVASNLFSENILLSITTKDYWNVANDYNPLMHLWYVGILFEFYLLFPVITIVCNNLFKAKWKDGSLYVIILLAISLALYLIPTNNDYYESLKFYHIPFRIFEFMAGGMVALILTRFKIEKKGWQFVSIVLLSFFLFSSVIYLDTSNIGTDVLKISGMEVEVSSVTILPKKAMLIFTVIVTSVAILVGALQNTIHCGLLEYVGKRSYSLFIWHQILIAFYRYFFSNEITLAFILLFALVLLGVSELSYRIVEKNVNDKKRFWGICILVSIFTMSAGGFIYVRAGVVRDVPELDIYKENAYRGMHAAYVDRAYNYDKDFTNRDGKKKVLVMGNSYGRDMCNVILESNYRDSVELSYVYEWDDKNKLRIPKADVIFVFSDKELVPDFVWTMKKEQTIVYGIGTKNYGQSNGIIYKNRFSNDYTKQTVPLHPWYRDTNEKWKREWGDHYINFIDMSLVGKDRVRLFSEDGKYISQDCYHLTPTGAKWYAEQIVFSKIFK